MWTSIIIHAVGVRSGIGFGDGNFIRAEGALQGRASSFRGWMGRGILIVPKRHVGVCGEGSESIPC
jgi:hypothetical protein